MIFKRGDRVVVKGTTEPVYSVVQQHGNWIGVRAEGSTRVREVDRQGFGTSDVDRAIAAQELEPAPAPVVEFHPWQYVTLDGVGRYSVDRVTPEGVFVERPNGDDRIYIPRADLRRLALVDGTGE